MPGPPPPPPMSGIGPPAPPMANLNNNNVKKPSANSGMDMRGALLSQIEKGTKLKKVITVDKSKPSVSGRVADSSNSSSPTKSTSSRAVGSTKTSPDSSTSSPIRQGGFMSLTDELQHKLTLKKNKNSPLKEARSIVEPKESSPPSVTSSSKTSFVNEIKSKQSVISPQHQSQTSSPVVSNATPNKSSLFNNNNNNISSSSNNFNNNNNNNNNSSYDNKSQPSAPKINHGKPNLAPKPPPQLSLPVNNSNNSSSNSLNDGNRKIVARHQSMKSPRSPPIGIAPTGPFNNNNDNHFGTMRNPSSQNNKIQEALNLQVVQKPVAQRPTNKPPPPPVPNRNLGTNLTQSHAKSTTALNNTNSDQNLNAPRRIPNSGSSNNISSIERNVVDTIDSSAPPLPPHRLGSAQKSQQHNQLQQSVNSQVPPEVPRRHSSMRQSIDNGHNKYPSPNHPPAPRLVVDLEARYSLLFHSISEFPSPKQFLNVDKSYPSKAMRPSNGF